MSPFCDALLFERKKEIFFFTLACWWGHHKLFPALLGPFHENKSSFLSNLEFIKGPILYLWVGLQCNWTLILSLCNFSLNIRLHPHVSLHAQVPEVEDSDPTHAWEPTKLSTVSFGISLASLCLLSWVPAASSGLHHATLISETLFLLLFSAGNPIRRMVWYLTTLCRTWECYRRVITLPFFANSSTSAFLLCCLPSPMLPTHDCAPTCSPLEGLC